MERQEISQNADWTGLIRHVARDQVSVELSDASVAVARLVPVKQPISMHEFSGFMETLPKLGNDAESFARDVEESNGIFIEEKDPWES